MKNGTSRAVLVGDLIRSDGPFSVIADDFVAQRCGFCSHPVDEDARFTLDGYWCSACATALAASVR
ncbi:MAG: hypothetical protein QNJ77_10945 [Acidimicrobiia bacterium]|nr:hypothetical protein [Acidimicrobiia bacterium]